MKRAAAYITIGLVIGFILGLLMGFPWGFISGYALRESQAVYSQDKGIMTEAR